MTQVLVIDDEKPTLAMFELLLPAMGYQPTVADSGERGLELFAAGDFPIVLTDIKMPGIDGLDVLSRIKALRPATEVIVITGHGDVDLALSALNLRATDFIDKPISQAALNTALRRAAERLAQRGADTPQTLLRQAGDAVVLDIAGTVSGGMEDLQAQVLGRVESRALLVSVRECASINGAGIEGLARLLQACKQAGLAVAVACPAGNFRRVFEAAGLAALAPIHISEALGLRALGIPAQ